MRANIFTILILLLASFALAFFIGCDPSDSDQSNADEEVDLFAIAKAEAIASEGPGEPALWKLSDEDSDVYIFGTVHLLRSETEWETDAITSAFNNSDRFYMEADILSPTAQQTMVKMIKEKGVLPAGESIYDFMDVGDAYNFKRALEKIDFDPKALDNLQPWYAGLSISQHQMITGGYNPLAGVEIVLIGRANSQNKTFGYFETLEDQMDVLSGGDFDEQLEGLIAMTDMLDQGTDGLDLLVDEWADGDVNGLGAIIAVPEMMGSEDMYDRLLTDRNRKWIPQIIDILDEPGSSFVAVGAAHLAGKDSVILMLEEEGFTAERIQ